MAVPTIASLTPSVGPSIGRMSVEINGTNFRPATTPDTGVLGSSSFTTAAVLFGGVPAYDVQVFSTTLLIATPPPGDPGPVDVQVQNLDQTTGEPISGEVVVASGAFTYVRPIHTAEYQSDLTRVVRTLIRKMKAALLIEITDAVHTDYDETTGDELHVTKFASLPGITLVGPDLTENRFYSLNAEPDFDDTTTLDDDEEPTQFVKTRVPYTVDLNFRVVGVSNSKNELLNLVSNFTAFMHATKYLVMQKVDGDPTKGTVKYEFDFAPDGQPKTGRVRTTEENNSNLRVFEAHIMIRGFDIETIFGVAAGVSGAGVPRQAVKEYGYVASDVPNLESAIQEDPEETP